MAQQSNPNTFSGGMVTDLDPAYQPKETYFTGLNIRVITNGDKSYTLENVKGPDSKFSTNVHVDHGGNHVVLTGNDKYIIHGAVVVDDYIITIESNNNDPKKWKIRKYTVSSNGNLSNNISTGVNGGNLWTGTGLFDDLAGKIEMEAVVETDFIHRIYCTDGITGLKSINLKDPNITTSTITDFTAFKPNVKSNIELVQYVESGGSLKYGSYSYVYRLATQGQSNYTDWSNITNPINIVKYSLTNNTSLGVSGGSSSENSSASIKLKISSLPSNSYDTIQIAAIHYTSENVSTISIIEEGTVSSSTYTFTHSGFETEKLLTGGIAAAIITNQSWNVCKTLSQKDNKLYAGNLKSL